MTSHADLGPAPRLPDVQPLLSQIAAAQTSPDDGPQTADSILSSIALLSSLPSEIHWLCSSSPKLLPIVAQAVQLWGYGEPAAQQKLAEFKPSLAAALSRCAGCAVEWQTGLRTELKRVFAVYSYDKASTAGFFAELENWDVERVGAGLDRAREFVGKVPMGWKHVEVRGPVLECLVQPRLLLRLSGKWRGLVLGFERIPAALTDKWFLGAMVLIFDLDERIVEIGEKMFKKRTTGKIGSSEFEEIFKPFIGVVTSLSQQVNNGNVTAATTLWKGIGILLRSCETSVIQTNLASPPLDVLKLLLSHLSTSGAHFPAMLTTLSLFLQSLSTRLWQHTTITPLNLVDLIFSNPTFEDSLLHPESSMDGPSFLFDWLPKFMSSLPNGKMPIISKILVFCFESFAHARFPEESRTMCLNEGLHLLKSIMQECTNDNAFSDRDVDMVFKTDVTHLVDKYSSIITRSAKSDISRATDIVSLRLSLDCLLLQDEMREILKPEVYRGRVTSTFHLSDLWNLIEDQTWTEDDTSLIRAILAGIPHAATLDLLDSKSFEGKDVDRVKRFTKSVYEIQRLIVIFFSKIMDFRPRIIRAVLEESEPACLGVVAHLLNAKRQNLENADLDLLKTAFDCSGKSELWKLLLRNGFEPSLRAVVLVSRHVLGIQRVVPTEKLKHWHRIYLLTYVGKIIKQSMQIVDILCSGRSGILTTTGILSTEVNARALETFWRTSWDVLNVAFISATSWAANEDKDVMKNFLRDVLESASVLFDSLKTLDATLSGEKIEQPSPEKASSTQRRLLKDVQTPLANLSKWLALNVDDLRETTLTLAIKILARFARAEVVVKEDTLVQYYRLAHGKKKNNMTEEQRERLLVALSEHDVEPQTRKAVEAMAATRIAGSTPRAMTPELTKGGREVIDITGDDEYGMDYISEGEMNQIMAQFEKVHQQQQPKSPTTTLKQTKLDFSKGTIRPVTSVSMHRTSSLSSKPPFPPAKPAPSASSSLALAQLRADFSLNRTKAQPIIKKTKTHRAPVAPPLTDGFGRPLPPQTQIPESMRPPQQAKRIEESSSSESESDDGEGGGGLFSIQKENKSPPKVRQIQKRKVQLLGEPVQSRMALQARDREFRRVPSERNLRARLTPDLVPLLKRVLSWQPAHPGPFPPYKTASDFKRVEATFISTAKYEETFEPLLMLECWQHIQQAKMEATEETFEFVIDNRQKLDEYVELFVTIKPLVYNRVGLLDPDLVIISNVRGSGGKECFAKVQGMKRKKESVELGLRCLPGSEAATILVPKATLYGVKLFSLTPILREYAALKGLPYYDLVEEILTARPSRPVTPSKYEIDFTMKTYAVNEPQAAAIIGACQNQGFSLIQGPPGTGKTKTILGMVGAFLTGNARPGSTSVSIPGQQSAAPPPRPRLLLCAPSNAAVDEIVIRLIGGIRNARGEQCSPKIVRVGRSDGINPNVRKVTLDELVDARLTAIAPTSQKDELDEQVLRNELNKILDLRNAKGTEYDHARETGTGDLGTLAGQLRELNAQKNRIGAQLDEQKEKRNAMIRDAEVNRRHIIAAILDDADVICCTLSGSGHDQLAQMKVNFETVIIDEAAQSIELSALIPLKYGCQRCILVGDPNQLAPTVLSQAAAKFHYEESLFIRMQRNYPKSVYLLSIQYRMNPEISSFPSEKFYDGKLIDGPEMASITAREWHQSPLFRPYCFFNVAGGTQERGKRGVSLLNRAEVNVALSIYAALRRQFDHIDFDGKIGIVTPYKEQLRELLRQFKARYGNDITNSIDFNTIDGFQGQEKDIIILSCVRGAQEQGVGFLKDVRRINVALTRAKSTLCILGNKEALKGNHFWQDLIVDAQQRGVLVDCRPDTFSAAMPIRVKSSGNTPKVPRAMKGAQAGQQIIGELTPLGRARTGTKKAPLRVDSDVEMKDAGDSSDSDSAESWEEGELNDFEMQDDIETESMKDSKKRKKDSSTIQENPKKVKKHQQTDRPNDSEKSKPVKQTSQAAVPTIPAQANDKHMPDEKATHIRSHIIPADPPPVPVIKRKAANPPSLFIKSKKPGTPTSNKVRHPTEKKESVRQRLARQVVRTPTSSFAYSLSFNELIGDAAVQLTDNRKTEKF